MKGIHNRTPPDAHSPLEVSALIVTRIGATSQLEILNVLARNKTRYGFPGGKLEEGESPLAAVIRETEEELGVTPTDIVYRDTFEALTLEGREIKMHVFTGTVTEDITPMNEIAEIHWLTYEQMLAKPELLAPITIANVSPFIQSL